MDRSKRQRGYMQVDFTGIFIAFGIICAVGGWALIEGVLWVLSHISISWEW